MKIPELLEDLAIISQLGDNPGSDDDLSAEALKAKFDEAALKIQKYINTVLIPAVNPAVIPDNYFAPAGYGLGESEGKAIADLNTADKNGWHYTYADTKNVPAFPGGGDYWKYASVYVERRSSIWYQTLKTIWGGKVVIGLRTSTDNGATWGEVEFFNPPMELGVEYRTIERWNGKAVYTKLVNCEALPNATTKEVAHGATVTQIIRCMGQSISNKTPIPRMYGNHIYMFADDVYIYITTTANYSNQHAYAQIWYTKD